MLRYLVGLDSGTGAYPIASPTVTSKVHRDRGAESLIAHTAPLCSCCNLLQLKDVSMLKRAVEQLTAQNEGLASALAAKTKLVEAGS